MNALTHPTVYSNNQADEIKNDIDRAISGLLKLRAAYDVAFVCQNIEGDRYTAVDLLEASRLADEIHSQLQTDLLTQVSNHLGAPVSTFDLTAINRGNDTVVADIRSEYSEWVEVMLEAA